MTWNYRIIKRDLRRPSYFAVHEVFYNDKGKITNWTSDAIDLTGKNPRDITKTVHMILEDIKTPVLVETELLKITKNRSKIKLVQTCAACPEQYDAFLDGKQVGYLRLRHGTFRVDYPNCGDETIYSALPKGDGMFEDDEREYYLYEALRAIKKRLAKDRQKRKPSKNS